MQLLRQQGKTDIKPGPQEAWAAPATPPEPLEFDFLSLPALSLPGQWMTPAPRLEARAIHLLRNVANQTGEEREKPINPRAPADSQRKRLLSSASSPVPGPSPSPTRSTSHGSRNSRAHCPHGAKYFRVSLGPAQDLYFLRWDFQVKFWGKLVGTFLFPDQFWARSKADADGRWGGRTHLHPDSKANLCLFVGLSGDWGSV